MEKGAARPPILLMVRAALPLLLTLKLRLLVVSTSTLPNEPLPLTAMFGRGTAVPVPLTGILTLG